MATDIFDLDPEDQLPPKARNTDPIYSHMGAEAIKPRTGALHTRIKTYLVHNPFSTQWEVGRGIGEEDRSVTPRFKELVDSGEIVQQGEKLGDKGVMNATYRLATTDELRNFVPQIKEQHKRITKELHERFMGAMSLVNRYHGLFPKEAEGEALWVMGQVPKKPAASVSDVKVMKESA